MAATKLVKYALIALSVLIAAFVGLSFYATEQMMRPAFYALRTPDQGLVPRDGSTDPLHDFSIPFESVEFPAVDRQTLRGWYVPGNADATAAIITVHGGGTDRRSYLAMVPTLHGAGYPMLLFDNREHGISDGHGLGMSLGMRESEDVSSAVDYMVTRGFSRFGVIGSSQGGTSAIVAAARDRRIGAVIAQGTGTNLADMMSANPALRWLPRTAINLMVAHFYFRQDADWPTIRSGGVWPIDVIGQISPRPILIIHGELDEMAPLALAEQIYAAAGEPKQFWKVEGAGHRGLREHAGAAYDQRVVEFYRQYLPAQE
jgi:pimeloyl-ACP methyl ester carboxylesterase